MRDLSPKTTFWRMFNKRIMLSTTRNLQKVIQGNEEGWRALNSIEVACRLQLQICHKAIKAERETPPWRQCAPARNKQTLAIMWSDVIFALVCNLHAWRMQKIISQVNSLALHGILLPSRDIYWQWPRRWGKTHIYIDLSYRYSSSSNPVMSLTSL